jgi:hypothetical protein
VLDGCLFKIYYAELLLYAANVQSLPHYDILNYILIPYILMNQIRYDTWSEANERKNYSFLYPVPSNLYSICVELIMFAY